MKSSTVDYYTDRGALFVKLFHARELPDFVKQGAVAEEFSLDDLPGTAFADAESRRLPIHTAANTFVSAVYFYAQPKTAQAKTVEEKLQKAAQFWSFDIQLAKQVVEDYNGKRGEAQEKADTVVHYCEVAGNPIYGVFSKEAAELSQQDFLSDYQRFCMADRYKIASYLLEISEFYGAPIQEDIYKFAGLGFPNMEILKAQLDARALMLNDLQKQAAVFAWSEQLTKAEKKDYNELHKLAFLIDEFDRQYGLTRCYGRRFADPHRSVYNTTHKEASEIVREVKLAGHTVLLSDLPGRDDEIYKIALSDARYTQIFESPFRSLDVCIRSLTEDEQRLVAQLL
jgi:hypothetical protein